MRVVRTPQGVRYDATGKADGRGAYLHDKRSCWEKALKGSLANALKTELSQSDRDHLVSIMNQLPADADEENPSEKSSDTKTKVKSM